MFGSEINILAELVNVRHIRWTCHREPREEQGASEGERRHIEATLSHRILSGHSPGHDERHHLAAFGPERCNLVAPNDDEVSGEVIGLGKVDCDAVDNAEVRQAFAGQEPDNLPQIPCEAQWSLRK